MMRKFLALFISLVYAAGPLNVMNINIENGPGFRFDQLSSDTFNYIMTFLSAEEVLSLKILSRGIYRKVRNLWPKMELSTTVDGSQSGRRVDFSHIVKIYGMNNLGDQVFTYTQAQLSCLRKFSILHSCIHSLQVIIDLLPKDLLTSLRLHNFGSIFPLINRIEFPKLTYLRLNWNIILTHETFGSLPNCMEVLKLQHMHINAITLSSLATALQTMDKLKVLSLSFCDLPKDGLSAIFETLPTSLKSLNICHIVLPELNKKSFELGLMTLKEMKNLQKINFIGINSEFAHEIILNLPKCIVDVQCFIRRENLSLFQQRSNEFKNVKRIYLPSKTHAELFPAIQKIFPNLDEDIMKYLDNL